MGCIAPLGGWLMQVQYTLHWTVHEVERSKTLLFFFPPFVPSTARVHYGDRPVTIGGDTRRVLCPGFGLGTETNLRGGDIAPIYSVVFAGTFCWYITGILCVGSCQWL